MQTQQGRPIIEGWDNLIQICKAMEKIDDDRQNIGKINQTMKLCIATWAWKDVSPMDVKYPIKKNVKKDVLVQTI